MITINGRFLEQPVTGVQRYSLELLGALDALLAQQPAKARSTALRCLTPPGCTHLPAWNFLDIQTVGHLSGNLWEQVDLPRAARGQLLFSPANIGPYLAPRQVVTIHDPSVFAVPYAYSFLFRLKYRTLIRRLGQIALRIITVSEFSRRELGRWCGIPAQRIQVIYEGHEHILRHPPDESIFDRHSIGQRPYFLTVGSNSPHKNFATAAAAFDMARLPAVDLVVTGGEFSKVFKTPALPAAGSLVRTGYLSDAELRALYQRAVGLIYPSRYEGFGLVPLEAMACGCPVICSSAASLPEVCGDAVLYSPPDDAAQFSAHLQRLLADPALRARLSAAGRAQAARFTWQQAARETWNVLAHALKIQSTK